MRASVFWDMIKPLLTTNAFFFNDTSINLNSYNTHGGLGDLIFRDTQQAVGKSKCMETLLTRSDVGLYQE